MKIRNTTSQTFKSIYRQTYYKDCNGLFRSTQNTTEAREDLDYVDFAKLTKKNFKGVDKINIMPMNGSDGTEAYLLANALIEVFGEEDAKKRIFPIEVTDVDKFIVQNYGQKGVVALKPLDIKLFGKNFDKYFTEIPISDLPKIEFAYASDSSAYKLKPEFKQLFNFKVMDFQERLEKIKDEGNSVVIIRNCLAQSFGEFGTAAILEKVAEKLNSKSLFIIGGYDRAVLKDMVPYMSILNFKEIGKNIFGLENLKNIASESQPVTFSFFKEIQKLLLKKF